MMEAVPTSEKHTSTRLSYMTQYPRRLSSSRPVKSVSCADHPYGIPNWNLANEKAKDVDRKTVIINIISGSAVLVRTLAASLQRFCKLVLDTW
jgi:hypothetical protein